MKQFKAVAIGLTMGIFLVAGSAVSQGETAAGAAGKTSNTDSRLGTPVHTETRDGIRVDVWLITHEMHGVSEAPPDNSAVDTRKSTAGPGKEEMEREAGKNMEGTTPTDMKRTAIRTIGTPEVAVVKISEVGTNVMVQNANVDLKVTSPAGKTSTVLLDYNKNEYVQDVQMTEKGTYKFELKVTRDGRTTSMNFTRSVPAS